MDKTNFQEIWQVDAGGQIYETSFEEMTQWIAEGALLPQDKVRRGNLRWIEAQKVPSLYGFFNAKEMGIAPSVVSTTNAQTTSQTTQTNSTFQTVGQTQIAANNPLVEPEENLMEKIQTRFCLVHIETKPNYFCGTCQNVFCQECPQSYGSVKICPLCGAMCLPIEDVVEKEHQVETLQVAITEGFGFKDFGRALAYPFKFKTSLFFGAMFFMFFSIGQHASALGGRWLISAAIISGMLANMLTFGILSNTVENMLQHKLNQNFMPSFDDFGLWDDVIQPFFLSIGVYLSSFGGLILLIIVMLFFVVNAVKSDPALANKTVPLVAPELNPNYQGAQNGQEQINAVKEAMKRRDELQKRQMETIQQSREENEQLVSSFENGEMPPTPEIKQIPTPLIDEEKEFQEMNETINKTRQQQLESTIGKPTEPDETMFGGYLETIKSWAMPFILLAGIFFLWGVFYLPVAYIVAAYTRNFRSVFNPAVGLDTIKRLGFDYVKILLMGFILLMFSGIVSMVLNIALAPFYLPRLGNIPAVAIGSIFTFYLYIVFSVILGYALYKNSDKFKMYQNS